VASWSFAPHLDRHCRNIQLIGFGSNSPETAIAVLQGTACSRLVLLRLRVHLGAIYGKAMLELGETFSRHTLYHLCFSTNDRK
jgi:hypothetical protein